MAESDLQDLLVGGLKRAVGNVDADVTPNISQATPEANKCPSAASAEEKKNENTVSLTSLARRHTNAPTTAEFHCCPGRCGVLAAATVTAADEKDFVQLFNGKDLTGWKIHSI